MTIDIGIGRIPTWTRADRLRKAREVAGLDQTALGQHIGVSRGTVSNAERGTVEPRRSVIMAWAMATGVPLTWIETGEAPSPGGDGASIDARPEGFEPPTFWLGASRRRPAARVVPMPGRPAPAAA